MQVLLGWAHHHLPAHTMALRSTYTHYTHKQNTGSQKDHQVTSGSDFLDVRWRVNYTVCDSPFVVPSLSRSHLALFGPQSANESHLRKCHSLSSDTASELRASTWEENTRVHINTHTHTFTHGIAYLLRHDIEAALHIKSFHFDKSETLVGISSIWQPVRVRGAYTGREGRQAGTLSASVISPIQNTQAAEPYYRTRVSSHSWINKAFLSDSLCNR